MHEIGADELTLRARETGVAGEAVFHFSRARFELGQQVAVPAFEILQDVVEEACGRVGIHREHPAHDMVGALPVGRVEVPRLGRRPERSNHNP